MSYTEKHFFFFSTASFAVEGREPFCLCLFTLSLPVQSSSIWTLL